MLSFSGFTCFEKVKELVFEGLMLLLLMSLGKFMVVPGEHSLN